MTHEYHEYMRSEQWQAVSQAVKQRAGWRCQGCNTSVDLQAHHSHYRHFRDEMNHLEDLICLCVLCHEAIHGVKNHRVTGANLARKKIGAPLIPGVAMPTQGKDGKQTRKAQERKQRAKERKAKAEAMRNHDWRKGLANPVPAAPFKPLKGGKPGAARPKDKNGKPIQFPEIKKPGERMDFSQKNRV